VWSSVVITVSFGFVMTWLTNLVLCVIVIMQAAAVIALPAFFMEYYTTAEGIVDAGTCGKQEITCLHSLVGCQWNKFESLCTDITKKMFSFYPCDAMLVWYLLSLCVRPSVCLPVTSRHCTKTAKHRITQTMPYNRPWTVVFWR